MGDDEEVINLDVDAATAKGYGDQKMDAGDYQGAIYNYLDGLDQNPDQEMAERLHYNLANAYRHLGDQANCLEHAKIVVHSANQDWSVYGLRLFYWASTGEELPGMST